jgi:death-on-curing protein
VWLTRVAVDVLHHDLLVEHGGMPGTRDENLLESTLARAVNHWTYERSTDLAGLAALYGHGLTRAHPYTDGNKRIGLLALVAFLDINGLRLEARDEEVVDLMRRVASGDVGLDDLAVWIREHVSVQSSPTI